MKILLTNDDGFGSAGLNALLGALDDHDVCVVAPDGERSGLSHSITLRDPVHFRKMGANAYACGGSPADCVLYSLLGAIDLKPDLVISGINHGPNLGTDIIYSGTAAAARQAALMGTPSVAVSAMGDPHDIAGLAFTPAAEFIARNLDLFLRLWDRNHFLNINVPQPAKASELAVEITRPSMRIYSDSVREFGLTERDRYFLLHGSTAVAKEEDETDWAAVTGGRISVSPIYLHPVNHVEVAAYRNAEFDLFGVSISK